MDGSTLRELEALFKWNPPRLELAVDASKSKYSRPPSFYDKHLSENLILKEVKVLRSLQQAIADVVDRTLSSIQQNNIALPPAKITANGDFVTEDKRRHVDYLENRPVRNKKSVANFYLKTTANYCVAVASTLALHPSTDDWYNMLQWDDVPSRSGYALADGVLRIDPSMRPILLGKTLPLYYKKKIMESLSKDRVDALAKVAEKFSDIMTCKITSLTVAPQGVMEAISDLADSGTFPWVTCHDVLCGHHHSMGGPHPISFDAAVTPWKIPSDASSSEDTDASPSGHDGQLSGAGSPHPVSFYAAVTPREIPSDTSSSEVADTSPGGHNGQLSGSHGQPPGSHGQPSGSHSVPADASSSLPHDQLADAPSSGSHDQPPDASSSGPDRQLPAEFRVRRSLRLVGMQVPQQSQSPDPVPKPPKGKGKRKKADDEDEPDSAPSQPKGKGKDIDKPDSVPRQSKGRRQRKKDEDEGEGEDEDEDKDETAQTHETLTAEKFLQQVLHIILMLVTFGAEISLSYRPGPKPCATIVL
jgi:hypothetical protein